MTDKEKKNKIADILMDFQEEYSNEVINRPMLASLYAGDILSFIDSLQEEPASEKKCMFTKDNYTDEDRKVLCENCKEKCEYSKKEEPVSEDLEKAAIQFATDTETGKVDVVKQSSFFWGAIYHKQQMMAKAIDGKVLINGMGDPILYLWDKGRYLIDKKVKVIVINEE